jgi:hypothetical protein
MPFRMAMATDYECKIYTTPGAAEQVAYYSALPVTLASGQSSRCITVALTERGPYRVVPHPMAVPGRKRM